MDNPYVLSGEIPPPCCWVENIGHTTTTEHQSCEAGLNGVKAVTPKKARLLVETNKWTNRKVIKLSLPKTIPKGAMECRTKVRGSLDNLISLRLSATIPNPPGDFTPLN